jgi:Aspartyl protease/PDZ domain
MKRLTSVTAFLLAVAVSLGPITGPAARAETPLSVAVPFELLKTKHIVIQIKINGKGPYRVIFDTGAPVMLLNTKVARESGLLAKNAKAPPLSLFGAMGQVKIKTLEIGSLKAEDLSAVVMDHPTVEVISKFLGPIEGIVGFPFFARYKMSLDYQAKQLTFVPNGFEPPDAMKTLMASMMALSEDKPRPKVLAPAGQWGMAFDEKKADDLEAGVTVREVWPDSAAARAGLQTGDRLLTLDGRWTDTLADAYQAAAHVKPETAAKVMIKRGTREIEVTVTPRAGL